MKGQAVSIWLPRRKGPITPSNLPEALLFNQDPSQYLPHRSPFLFLDTIIDREPGVSAAATLVVTTDMTPFPAVLLIESMAQLGGIAAGQVSGAGGVLAAISGGKLPAAVPAGKYLIKARIIKSFAGLHMVEGEVRSGDEVVAAATLTLAVGTVQG